MAEISLREYLAKLDNLLTTGVPSEVIHHCRHILQYYPKNAEAYRLLGRALVYNQSWQEAGEVLRRVLSVFPDDFSAHAGLSEVALRDKRLDDAIWHLERAFEQDPNSQSVLDTLRELYRKHRRQEHAKVQLTAGAVARQYIRNGLYEQAIDTLQQTLERSPDRVDLRLLLAQTYRDAGYKLESGEMAVQVLQPLPDCLEANRILAELWLSEERPSDAQRYINRIQSVAPYLALELAQGGEVDDASFKLEELDYRRAAQREIVAQSPDWLQTLDQAGESTVTDDWMGTLAAASAPAEADADELPTFDESFSTELPDDWLADIPDAPAADPVQPVKKDTGGLTGMLAAYEKSTQPEEPDEFDDLFNAPVDNLFGDAPPVVEAELDFEQDSPVSAQNAEFDFELDSPVPAANLDELFPDMPELPPVAAAPAEEQPVRRQTGALKETDPLAWLHESGIEIVEQQPAEPDHDVFGVGAEFDTGALAPADAANPLAWMQGYGGDDMLLEAAPEIPAGPPPTDELPINADDVGDPLAWMHDSGVEMVEEQPAFAVSESAPEADPLDWLADESLLDEALNLEDLIDLPRTGSGPAPAAVADDEPVWQPTTERQDIMSDPNDSGLDWLNDNDPAAEEEISWADEQPEAEADVLPTWVVDMQPAQAAPPSTASETTDTGGLDWLSSEQADFEPAAQGDTPDWLNQMDDEPQAAQPTMSSAGGEDAGFEWLSGGDSPEPEPAMQGDTPNWLTQMGDDESEELQPAMQGDTPNWLSQMGSDDDESEELQPAMQGDTPDWLTQMDDAEIETGAQPAMSSAGGEDAGFEWLSGGENAEPEPAMQGDTPNWLSQMGDDEREELQPAAQGDVPDWLNQMDDADIETGAQPAMSSAGGEDAGFEWLSGGENAEPEPAMQGDTPDWLTPMGDDESEELQPAMQGDTPDWLSQMGDDDESEELQPAVQGDTPDWLNQMDDAEIETGAQPAMSSVGGEDAGFEWLSGGENAEPEPAMQGDTPDWLSQMGGDDDESEELQPAAQGDTPNWLSQMGGDESEELQPAMQGDVPDWLNQMDDADIETGAQPAMTSAGGEDAGFEWLSGSENAEPEPAMQGDTPDWLTPMGDDESEELQPAVQGDTPDWLSQMGDDDESEALQPVTQGGDDSGFEWVNETDDEQADLAPATAGDMPDWLGQLQDEETAGAEPVAQGDMPDWLNQLQDAGPQAETSAVAPAADMPNWFDAMGSGDAEQGDLEPAIQDDIPDWLNEMEDEETAESQPVTRAVPRPGQTVTLSDAADWLQDIRDTQGDFDPLADEPVTSEFSWIDDINAADGKVARQPAAEDAELESYAQAEADGQFEEDLSAVNAPDWLNAMVPGLDVDYEAPEDAPIEQEFLPGQENRMVAVVREPLSSRSRRDFDWLTTLVEDETQQISAVKDTSGRRRFIFSRLPAWLRRPTEQADKPAPQLMDSEDDLDTPPWLR